MFSPLAPVDFHGHFGEITSSSVSVPITFSWRDPGQGTLKQAEWFRLFEFVDRHKPPIKVLSSSEPHLSTDLAFHTNYWIRLRAVNIDIES